MAFVRPRKSLWTGPVLRASDRGLYPPGQAHSAPFVPKCSWYANVRQPSPASSKRATVAAEHWPLLRPCNSSGGALARALVNTARMDIPIRPNNRNCRCPAVSALLLSAPSWCCNSCQPGSASTAAVNRVYLVLCIKRLLFPNTIKFMPCTQFESPLHLPFQHLHCA